jgi:hypothetical protein
LDGTKGEHWRISKVFLSVLERTDSDTVAALKEQGKNAPMLLIAALAFTAIFALALAILIETISLNAAAIRAALAGRSFLSQPPVVSRPVTVRMASRRVSRPVTATPRLRAAA